MWNTLTLTQYLALQTALPGTAPEDRLRLALAVVRGVAPRRLRRLRGPRLMARAGRALAFLQTPMPAHTPGSIRLGGTEWVFTADVGALPLGAWVVLEREWLAQPPRLAALLGGNWAALSHLLAIVARPAAQGFDTRQLPARAAALGALPVPVALGWLLATVQGVQAVHSQYPSLFQSYEVGSAGDASYELGVESYENSSNARDENTKSPQTPNSQLITHNYHSRWGWNALLAELCGGVVSPSARQEWFSAPAHLAFQELARLGDYRQCFHIGPN